MEKVHYKSKYCTSLAGRARYNRRTLAMCVFKNYCCDVNYFAGCFLLLWDIHVLLVGLCVVV